MKGDRSILFEHPLKNTWTLRRVENDHMNSWDDPRSVITTFDTINGLCMYYYFLRLPTELKYRSHYSLFKKGIRPVLAHPANKNGGRWVATIDKSSEINLNNLWRDVILCLIDEQFDNSDDICGAVINKGFKTNKISIWTTNGSNEKAVLEIGNKLKRALRLGPQKYQYQLHEDFNTGSNAKSIYTL